MKYYNLGHNINILGRLFVKRLNEKITRTGITVSQWSIIDCFQHFDELTQTGICEQLSIEAPAVSKTINDMESSGWLTRMVNENDKRERKVTLTDKATKSLPTWTSLSYELQQQALDGISTEDIETVDRVINQMINNLKNID